jgi:hypothetical protein
MVTLPTMTMGFWEAVIKGLDLIERSQCDGAESGKKKDKHEEEKDPGGSWRAGKLAPDEDAPAG